MVSKLLLAVSLAVAPVVSVSAQSVNETFDTFQAADKYLEDFDYLTEKTYRLTFVEDGALASLGQTYIFYAFPIYYDIVIQYTNINYILYYQNDYYKFLFYEYRSSEVDGTYEVLNYVGEEIKMPFLALDYIGMNCVIEHDKAENKNL